MSSENSIPRSNAKDLTKIRIRKQNRNPNVSKRKESVGADTETHGGDIFLAMDSDGNSEQHPNITFEKVAELLLCHHGKPVWFHNLEYDADCILKLLPEEILTKQYVKNGRLKFEYNGYTIFYIVKKKLTITRNKRSVSCYDIAQYYDNKALNIAYKENIGKDLPADYLELKGKRHVFSLRYFKRHKKAMMEYCRVDCTLPKELAENWMDTFAAVYGFYPRNWISSGYLAEKVLIYNKIPIPYFNDIPYPVQETAWAAFYGGRFELVKRGYIGKCWLYDINSAYPYALTKLPDLTKGDWIYSKRINQKAAVGFFLIRAHIDDEVKVAPFPFRKKDGGIIYPVGDFETFVTLEELKAVEGDKRIRYEILEGYQFLPSKDCTYPFKQFIEEQYSKRLALHDEGNPLERAIKIILNSIYGKTAERVNNRIGNIYVPAIAAFITGFARAQLYRFMREHNLENHVVAFATDSIAVTKEILGLDSRKLGEMKLDKYGEDVIYLSNGFYRFNGKWKQRGIGYDHEKKLEIEHLDTRISEDGQLYIAVTGKKTTHIRSGILYNKLKSVGKIEEYEKKIRLNSDKKRTWIDRLESLHQKKCCESGPINITLDANIIAKKREIEWEDEKDEIYRPESNL